jgi:ParB/RepB/Spo0J family partition protein
VIGKLLDLPVDNIDDGSNVRTSVDAGLKASVLAVGVLQPITVSPLEDDRYRCLYGHRRLAAARAAGLANIPAIVVPLPEELPLRQLMENQQRRAVDQLDVARTLRAWLEEDPSRRQRDLAAKLGRSTHWVSTRLTLLEMSPELQGKVASGATSLGKAYGEHKASTPQEPGRGRRRTLTSMAMAGTSRVVVELPGHTGDGGQATIEIDHRRGSIDLLLEDNQGYGVMVTMNAGAASLLARRLTQAVTAAPVVAARAVA